MHAEHGRRLNLVGATQNVRQIMRVLGPLAFIAIVLAACGSSDNDQATGNGAATSELAAQTPGIVATSTGSEAEDSADASAAETQAADPGYQATMDARVSDRPTPAQKATLGPSSFDAEGDGFYTFDEFREAVIAIVDTFDWSPNYPVTADSIRSSMVDEPDGDPRFEVGYEYTALFFPHACGWWQTWMEARAGGDTDLEAQALNQMLNVIPASPALDPGAADYYRDVGQRAQLGDSTGVIRALERSCAGGKLPPRIDNP